MYLWARVPSPSSTRAPASSATDCCRSPPQAAGGAVPAWVPGKDQWFPVRPRCRARPRRGQPGNSPPPQSYSSYRPDHSRGAGEGSQQDLGLQGPTWGAVLLAILLVVLRRAGPEEEEVQRSQVEDKEVLDGHADELEPSAPSAWGCRRCGNCPPGGWASGTAGWRPLRTPAAGPSLPQCTTAVHPWLRVRVEKTQPMKHQLLSNFRGLKMFF